MKQLQRDTKQCKITKYMMHNDEEPHDNNKETEMTTKRCKTAEWNILLGIEIRKTGILLPFLSSAHLKTNLGPFNVFFFRVHCLIIHSCVFSFIACQPLPFPTLLSLVLLKLTMWCHQMMQVGCASTHQLYSIILPARQRAAVRWQHGSVAHFQF